MGGSQRSGVVAACVATGIVVALVGPAPTGLAATDAVLLGLGAALLAWVGAASARTPLAAAVVIAGASTLNWLLAAAAASLAVVVAVTERNGASTKRHRDTGRARETGTAALAGAALILTTQSTIEGFHGASTLVAAIVIGIIVVSGLLAHRRSTTIVAAVTAVAICCAVAATASLGAAGYQAIDEVREGQRLAEQGLRRLGDGDIDEAQALLADAADAFARADRALGSPLAAPAALVPVVAQHRRAALDVSAAAATATQRVVDELESVDYDDLTIVDGRIDIDALAALAEPLESIRDEIGALGQTIADVDSPWLVDPLTTRLDELAAEIDEQLARSDDAIEAVRRAPRMLGADGPRTYLLAFMTPAELRGLGGLMGNWAEITIDNGEISITGFGRSDDLDDAAEVGERKLDGPDEWLTRYGPFGFTNWPGDSVGVDPWKNLTMSPQMSSTGEVARQLYAQSGGGDIDGVIALDVYALSRLLRFTGPIEIESIGRRLSEADAVEFLLNEQYDIIDTQVRVDLLEEVSQTVIRELLDGALPPPIELLDALGPMVEQGRLAAWATDPDEQALFDRFGLAGGLPQPQGNDALAITINNSVGNKIDYYLDAEAVYDLELDEAASTASGEIRISLENSAPSSGKPEYVIGNPIGLDDGTNRSYVSIYTTMPVSEVRIDGEPAQHDLGIEAGYFVTSVLVDIPAGGTADIVATVDGPQSLTDGTYELSLWSPATVRPTPIIANVRGAHGEERFELGRAGSETFSVELAVSSP